MRIRKLTLVVVGLVLLTLVSGCATTWQVAELRRDYIDISNELKLREQALERASAELKAWIEAIRRNPRWPFPWPDPRPQPFNELEVMTLHTLQSIDWSQSELELRLNYEPTPVLVDDLEAGETATAIYLVGKEDLVTVDCIDLAFPAALADADGGTIRLIMQDEVHSFDRLRVIDEHMALEWTDDSWGDRGRYPGRSGWTRQSGGGDYTWILGDDTAHVLADPWGWVWIVDYAWGDGDAVLEGEQIRICAHPHVTARVVVLD